MIGILFLFQIVQGQILQKLMQNQKPTILLVKETQFNLNQEFSKIINLEELDCDKEQDEICSNKGIYLIYLNKYHIYKEGVEFNDFIKNNIPSYSSEIKTPQEMDTFLNMQKPKLILFTKKQESKYLFKYLTILYNQISFATINQKQKQLLKHFNVNKFPTLLLINSDLDLIYYQGSLKLNEIQKFLDEKKNIQKIQSHGDFKNYILREQEFVLLNVYKDGEKSQMHEIKRKFGNMIKYFGFKIKNEVDNRFAQNTFETQKYPQLILYKFTQNGRKDKVFLDNDITVEDLVTIVDGATVDDTTQLNLYNFEKETKFALQNKKTILILFYDGETPISYKVISQMNRFKHKFMFSQLKDAPAHIVKKFGVKKTPCITVIKKKNMDLDDQSVGIMQYEGKIHYNSMVSFLDGLIGYKFKPREKKETNVYRVSKNLDMLQNCISEVCFIGLLNGKDENLFLEQQKPLQEMRLEIQTSKASFITMDGVCQHEMQYQMGINYTPFLFAYYPHQNQYVQMLASYEIESIRSFVQNVLDGQVSSTAMKIALFIQERDCVEFYKKSDL